MIECRLLCDSDKLLYQPSLYMVAVCNAANRSAKRGKNNMYLNLVKRNIFLSRILQFLLTLIVTIVHFEINILYLFFSGSLFFGLLLYFMMRFVFANSESRQLNLTLLFIDMTLVIVSILALVKSNMYSYFVVLISSLRFPYVEFCKRFNVS